MITTVRKEILNARANFDIKKVPGSMRDKVQKTMKLSDHKNKTEEERFELYSNINDLVKIAKNNEAYAKEVLYYCFFPKIILDVLLLYKRYAIHYYPRIALEDIFQQAYLTFESFIQKHDTDIATFGYYVKNNFWKRLRFDMEPDFKYVRKASVRMSTNSQARDELLGTKDCLYDVMATKDLLEEISKILKKYSKNAKSATAKVVCDEVILKGRTCQEIAQELGLTYHAIYEIKGHIEKMIADMINHSNTCSYYITFSNDSYKRYRIEERTNIEYTSISVFRCSHCNAKLRRMSLKKEERRKGYTACSCCGTKNFFRLGLN